MKGGISMTGRELIIHILENNLEDEPVFKDGTFVGYIPVSWAAVKMGVGVSTIIAWIAQNRLDYLLIGDEYFVSADCKSIPIYEQEK
jgi:hypothetical protein